MKISLNWLQNFIDLTETDHEKIKEVITARSAEIETMENTGEHLEGIVLGHIDKLMPHPNADKLQLTIIDNGQEKLQVVCGGSNLKEGMKVAFAQIGAVVKWSGKELIKMEKAKIRGEESFGMICASEEIGLSEMYPAKEEHEIIDLSHIDAPIGTPLAKVLGMDDTVIDVDNHAITNRADLFSHRGFAREFVACGLAKWTVGDGYIRPKLQTDNNTPLPVEIEIKDPETCTNYLAIYITGIEVKESPEWMQKHLSACGIRPISNIVDITNYVMLELGMPLHAFDLDQIKGKKWVMRKSKKGEKVITLDEKEIELFDGITILEDGHEIFDLCGIMGSLHSGIKAKTNRVVLHAPVFNPSITRRAVRGLGQISDASTIYEKGVDNELAMDGLIRAVNLILEICPNAKIASKILQHKNYKPENRIIKLRNKQVERLVGAKISSKEITKILTDLGFELKENKEGFDVNVPSWRLNDVNMEADLIEEVARIYGYDEIPFDTPNADISPIPISKHRVYEKEMKDNLVSLGFNEIYTFAFLGEDLLAKSSMASDGKSIHVANPISNDMAIMRQSLLPRTLEVIADNLRYQKEFSLFEMSRTYHKKGSKCEERNELILATAGKDFRELQGIIETLGFTLKPTDAESNHIHPGRQASLILRGQSIGSIYELHPQIAKNFGLKATITIAEVDISAIHDMNMDHVPKFVELPKFPAIQLDVSIMIPKKGLSEKYLNAIRKSDKTLVRSIELIDEYTGDKIGTDKRSLTYSITYRSDTETLTDEQVSGIHQKVLANLKTAGASIRD